MKLFGQFLMDQGLVTKEDFVRAMVDQANRLPALASAVYELKLLTDDQLVEVFNYQAAHLKEFRMACVELDLWVENEFDHALGRYYLSRIDSLGDRLVAQGSLTITQLSDSLARYVELGDYTAQTLPIPAAKPAASRPAVEKTQDVEKRDPFVLSPAEKMVCFLYLRFFNEACLAKLGSVATADEQKEAKKNLVALRTAAGLLHASNSQAVIDAILLALDHFKPESDPSAAVEQGVSLLWELRESFANGLTEAGALSNKTLKQQLDLTLATLKNIG